MILNETQRFPVDLMFNKTIEVSLIAEMSQKITNIIDCPRVKGSSSRMGISCGHVRGEEEGGREGLREENDRAVERRKREKGRQDEREKSREGECGEKRTDLR